MQTVEVEVDFTNNFQSTKILQQHKTNNTKQTTQNKQHKTNNIKQTTLANIHGLHSRPYGAIGVAMSIDKLIRSFSRFDTSKLRIYEALISSKDDNKIFPPYVPHVGNRYEEYGIMMYGMAQSITKTPHDLINKSRNFITRQMFDAPTYNDIQIAPYKVMLSAVGVYIYVVYGDVIESFDDIHDCIAVSNYYKFSLSSSGKDINPDSSLKHYIDPEDYWKVNDQLSAAELNCLKPSTLFSFNGRHNNIIMSKSKNGIPLIETINDPSWILQGHGGHLKTNRSWYRKTDDKRAIQLVNSYLVLCQI